MKKLLIAVFMTFILGDVMANDKVTTALSQFAWEKRQLIVFSPSPQHPQYLSYKKQAATFKPEFKDRKLHSWFIVADSPVMLNESLNKDLTSQNFRETFAIRKNEFRVLLLGYDQGVKLRQELVNLELIFSTIDQMPMRAQEMREN